MFDVWMLLLPLIAVIVVVWHFRTVNDWRRIRFIPYYLCWITLSACFALIASVPELMGGMLIILVIFLAFALFSLSSIIIARRHGLITGIGPRLKFTHFERDREDRLVRSKGAPGDRLAEP